MLDGIRLTYLVVPPCLDIDARAKISMKGWPVDDSMGLNYGFQGEQYCQQKRKPKDFTLHGR